MQEIRVLVTNPTLLSDETLAELQALDPRLRLETLPNEERPFLVTGKGDDPSPEAQSLARRLAEVEVILGVMDTPADLKQRAPRLRWFHTIVDGIEQFVRAGLTEQGFVFTNGAGPSAVPIAEYVLMAILAMAKKTLYYIHLQDERRWERGMGVDVRGKTVGIVGLGQIGVEVARLAKAFDCRVVASRRSVTEPQENTQGVDLLLPAGDLQRLLGESDFVVLAAPATDETQAMINAETLQQMKPGSYLINVARGSLVDEQALVAALNSGHLGGAVLDVAQREPLPPESGLWQAPGLIITPHNSAVSERFWPEQVDLFKDNLRRYLRGEPLRNVVPPGRGY